MPTKNKYESFLHQPDVRSCKHPLPPRGFERSDKHTILIVSLSRLKHPKSKHTTASTRESHDVIVPRRVAHSRPDSHRHLRPKHNPTKNTPTSSHLISKTSFHFPVPRPFPQQNIHTASIASSTRCTGSQTLKKPKHPLINPQSSSNELTEDIQWAKKTTA
jgi:hypothetical protein